MYYWFEREIRGIQNREACGINVGLCIVGCLMLLIAYSILALVVSFFLHVEIPVVNGITIPRIMNPTMFLVCIVFLEELIFRLPLAVFVHKKWSMNRILVVAVLLSISFGLYHGSTEHIFLQGVGGFIYSLLFLKCGGSQGNYGKGIAVTFTTHLLYDLMLPLIFLG